jgi:hypothetical protein
MAPELGEVVVAGSFLENRHVRLPLVGQVPNLRRKRAMCKGER